MTEHSLTCNVAACGIRCPYNPDLDAADLDSPCPTPAAGIDLSMLSGPSAR
jgi:hypothetical protein